MLTPQQRRAKVATRELTAAAGGVEAAALSCRLGKSQIAASGSVNEVDRFLPLDAIVALEAATEGAAGWPAVTRFLAAESGHALVPLAAPGSGDAQPVDWLQFVGKLVKELGDLVPAIMRDAPAGMTAADIRRSDLLREFDELVELAVQGRSAIRAILDAAR